MFDKGVTKYVTIGVMVTKTKKRYDSKYKVTRIHLGDYLTLKRISQAAGVSMAEALHKLIEHQAQYPMLDRAARPMPVAVVTAPRTAAQVSIAGMPAEVRIESAIVKLRVKVAGKENGHVRQ